MSVRLRDLIIVLLNLTLLARGEGFCSGKLYGVECCKKVVSNPEYDKNGYPYGTENGKSCIVPKGCSDCITKGNPNSESSSSGSRGNDSATNKNDFCTGKLYGFPCCQNVVYNPEYDSNGYPYGTENGKSCIIPKDCQWCVKDSKTVTKYDDKGFCIGSLYGFPCCQKVVSNPEYDANGNPYGTEDGKSCIVPKKCKYCVQGFCHGRMYGFPCCTERATNPDYDSEGNAYSKQGNSSCIIPKGCTKCIMTARLTPTSAETTKTVSKKWSAMSVPPTAEA